MATRRSATRALVPPWKTFVETWWKTLSTERRRGSSQRIYAQKTAPLH